MWKMTRGMGCLFSRVLNEAPLEGLGVEAEFPEIGIVRAGEGEDARPAFARAVDEIHALHLEHPVPPAELPRFHRAAPKGDKHGDGIVGDGGGHSDGVMEDARLRCSETRIPPSRGGTALAILGRNRTEIARASSNNPSFLSRASSITWRGGRD